MYTLDGLRPLVLHEIRSDPDAELLSVSRSHVLMFDLQTGRELRFRVRPHTPESLARRIKFAPGACPADKWPGYRRAVARALLRLPPEVLLNLNDVYVIGAADDLAYLAGKYGLDEECMPGKLLDEDGPSGLNPDFLGLHWWAESSVFVNVAAIKATAEDICGGPDAPDLASETDIGFWTTLLHELRHLQMDDCPYDFPWLKDADASEAGVEAWALDTYETLFRGPLPKPPQNN